MSTPSSKAHLPVEWVTVDIIRKYLNEGNYFEQVKSGQLIAYVKRSSHPATPVAGEPVCTLSQILFYYTQNHELVAIVHQYLRPDGTLGLSGKPDPKRLFLKDKIISVRTSVKGKSSPA